MAYIDIVTALALLQFIVFGFQVGSARGKYGVKAPAITGNEVFERHFRVQQNTLEQLIAFPAGAVSLRPLLQSPVGGGSRGHLPDRPPGLFRELRQRSELPQRRLRYDFPSRP